MTIIEENKSLAKRFVECRSMGQLLQLPALMAPNFVLHVSDWPHPLDKDQYLEGARLAARAFSGLTFTVEDLLAEDDKVAVRMTVRGRHTGIYQGIAPTDKDIEFSGISIQRIANGKVAEEWQTSDQLSLLRQLGKITGWNVT